MEWETVKRSIYACRNEFDFVSPPEAPVFEPTIEEFSDPIGYINKIRSVAEKTGICKIRPPARWQPPFSLDIEKLKFVPRIQKLNELEGVTRVKLNFLDKITKFWHLQGRPLKVPILEERNVDLFSLFHIVKLEGGPEKCTQDRRWRKVASMMGYNNAQSIEAIKSMYERILLPYFEFDAGKIKFAKRPEKPTIVKSEEELKNEVQLGDYKLEIIEIDADLYEPKVISKTKYKTTKTGSDFKLDPEYDEKCNRELRRLQCYGAGPKMPGCVTDGEENIGNCRKKHKPDPLAYYRCVTCKLDTNDEDLLVCNGCSETYHTFCLTPPLSQIPDGDWCCLACIAEEIQKPVEAFGFAQAEREYTLQQFGEMADRFKSDYFNMPGHDVSSASVEREFWRIVTSTEEDVTVEYGADLHSMDHGSGFPTKSSMNISASDQEYVDSGWNLNNLPILDGSVLRYINTDISGMTVPWMYVGMCFSAFCWHNEDHWSYSINFLHWGEVKTWYGVPGSGAELLEKTMKAATPELFQSQPDLLHQLVTILNPNILMDAGVPIYRTDQKAGEFVVTFPRSYHTGFNQGYNFAEAVNFAPYDWLPIGRDCIKHYKNLKRFCVFSHEELICRMALEGDKLDMCMAFPTYKELVLMVEQEASNRGLLKNRGVTRSTRFKFELQQDDARLCEFCKTTCFSSALLCTKCNNMVCLDHTEEGCECSVENFVLHYRYNLTELHSLLDALKLRVKSYDKWATDAKSVLKPFASLLGRADKIKSLLEDAKDLHIPNCDLLRRLMAEDSKINKVCETVVIELDD